MSKQDYTPIPKSRIKPVRLVVTLEANKVNRNGTFSCFNVLSVEGPNDRCVAISPDPKRPDLLMFIAKSNEGVELIPDSKDGGKTPVKVFDIK